MTWNRCLARCNSRRASGSFPLNLCRRPASTSIWAKDNLLWAASSDVGVPGSASALVPTVELWPEEIMRNSVRGGFVVFVLAMLAGLTEFMEVCWGDLA